MPRGRKAGGAGGVRRLVSTGRAIAALELQARFWEERAQQMRDAVAEMRRQLREAERAVRGGGLRLGGGRAAGGTGRRGRRGEGAGSVSAKILREWGRPARAGELLPELARRGVRVGGKNPMATLASTLLKYSGVKRAGRGLFIAANSAGGGGKRKRKRRAAKAGSTTTPPPLR